MVSSGEESASISIASNAALAAPSIATVATGEYLQAFEL